MLEEGSTCGEKGCECRDDEEESAAESVLFPVTVFLFIIVGVMTIMFGAYCTRGGGKDHDEVCLSVGCVKIGSMMAGKMDRSVDPCEDFDHYACGSYYKNTPFPEGLVFVESDFNKINEENQIVLRRILEEKVKDDDPSFIRKIKTYYKNCMDEDTIDDIGLEPYVLSKFPKLWPTLNPDWTNESFNLNDILELYARDFSDPLFYYGSAPDIEDTSKNILATSQVGFVIPLAFEGIGSGEKFIKFYGEFAKELGASDDVAYDDGAELDRFNSKLAEIMFKAGALKNRSQIVRSTIKQMSTDYPGIDFHRIIQAGFDSINKKVPKDQPVIYISSRFFKNVKSLLDKTQIRNIMNRFAFNHAWKRVGKLTGKMRALMHEYTKIMSFGLKEREDPRWRECIKEVDKFFLEGLGKAFVKEKISEDSKQYVETMVANTRREYEDMFKESKWVDPQTKKAALLKLNRMASIIAYPDNNFSNDELDKRYQDHTVYDGEYYKTFVGLEKKIKEEDYRLVGKDVDRKRWSNSLTDWKAYYDKFQNKIVIPAGILQLPFFSDLAPSSVNYAAIGAIIGHEISHGFDSKGSKINHEGKHKNWWQPETWKKFLNRTKCVVDHYSKFEIRELMELDVKNKNLNGARTLEENVADIGGLNVAYRVYKAHSAKQPTEKLLPGLGLTPDQQFFLAYSQLWCQKGIQYYGKHSPGRFRIKGPLQNNYDFPKAFKCPAGSPMNPVDKCRVWF